MWNPHIACTVDSDFAGGKLPKDVRRQKMSVCLLTHFVLTAGKGIEMVFLP